MAKYTVNPAGVAKCRALIEAKQYVLDSDWGSAQPKAEAENAFLEKRSQSLPMTAENAKHIAFSAA